MSKFGNVIQTIENVLPDVIEKHGIKSDIVKEYKKAQQFLMTVQRKESVICDACGYENE